MTKETLKQTLEAFEALVKHFSDVSAYEDEEYAFTDELIFIPNIKKAIKAIAAAKEVLAQPEQPEQEPVAWMYQHPNNHLKTCYQTYKPNGECAPLYTTPPQRTWVGLTEVDILAASRHWRHAEDFMAGVYWAAGTLKEFNT